MAEREKSNLMNVLEKILEEIKELKRKQNNQNQDYRTGYFSALSTVERIICSRMDEVRDMHGKRLIDADLLMRKCEKWLKPKAPDEDEIVSLADIAVSMIMEIEEQPTVYVNDGWIPVEERLPEDCEEIVLVQVSGKMAENIWFDNAFELATYVNGEGWILENYPECENPKVIAWQPLPEPYKPKKDALAAEHIMSRFMKVE